MIDEPPLDAPDEDWSVWADAMQQRGDPRGELLALGHPLPYVRAHADALFGRTLAKHVRDDHLRITKWRRYWPDEIELRIDAAAWGPQLVVDVASGERMQHVRGVTIAGVPSGDAPISLRQTLGWFRESRLAGRITSLALVDDSARSQTILHSPTLEPATNAVHFGPLAEIWLACPQLEHFEMVVADPAQIQFHVIRLPSLRTFRLSALAWVEGLAEMLANARWPQLRSFETRVVDSFDRATTALLTAPPNLAPLLAQLRHLPVERLALTSFLSFDPTTLLEDLPPSLAELDLSDSSFDERHAPQFAAHPRIRQLRRLVLRDVWLRSTEMFAGMDVVHSHLASAPKYRHVVG